MNGVIALLALLLHRSFDAGTPASFAFALMAFISAVFAVVEAVLEVWIFLRRREVDSE